MIHLKVTILAFFVILDYNYNGYACDEPVLLVLTIISDIREDSCTKQIIWDQKFLRYKPVFVIAVIDS